jgi:hypothetical protein
MDEANKSKISEGIPMWREGWCISGASVQCEGASAWCEHGTEVADRQRWRRVGSGRQYKVTAR